VQLECSSDSGILMGVLLISVSPAFAEFKSTKKLGAVEFLKGGVIKVSGTEVKCPQEGIKAQWHIGKGQIKLALTEETEGSFMNIQVKSWGKCVTLIGSEKFPTENQTLRSADN
jgi:hypothetical protein